jgi:hypothetical protein
VEPFPIRVVHDPNTPPNPPVEAARVSGQEGSAAELRRVYDSCKRRRYHGLSQDSVKRAISVENQDNNVLEMDEAGYGRDTVQTLEAAESELNVEDPEEEVIEFVHLKY